VLDVDACDDAMLVSSLRRLGGVPELLFEDEDIRAEMLRVVRADYRMIRGYQFPSGATVGVPITAMLGDHDPKNSRADADGWSRHTRAGFGVEMLPGGHFYLNDQIPVVASLIARRIRLDAGPAAQVGEQQD
jgi:surfactin synthase thioesterase subunit